MDRPESRTELVFAPRMASMMQRKNHSLTRMSSERQSGTRSQCRLIMPDLNMHGARSEGRLIANFHDEFGKAMDRVSIDGIPASLLPCP